MGWAVDLPGGIPEYNLAPEDGDIYPGTALQHANDSAASTACRAASTRLVGFNADMEFLVPVLEIEPGDLYIF